MAVTLTFHPLGNADCTRIDLKDGRKILVDYADMRNEENAVYGCIDLQDSLRMDLRAVSRDYYDVVLFTHLDRDHTYGADSFFHFDRFSGKQGGERIKMNEMWVPAAALTEDSLADDAWTIRQEARYRFIQGYGIRVFSRPECLKDFCDKNGIRLEDRSHLITDAGQLVPGYDDLNAAGGVEIFIHSPMAWRQDDRGYVERNEDAVVFHATFRELGRDTKVLFASDVNDETLSHIVQASKKHEHTERLQWDVYKIPHHCSYKSLNCQDKGVDKTMPIEDVRWLCEDCAQVSGIMVSTSKSIPGKGTPGDVDVQPPHRQAANYYEEAIGKVDGQFEVTMDHSSARNPKPFKLRITETGAAVALLAIAPATYAAASPARAG